MKYINQLDYPNLKYVTMTEMEGVAKETGKNTTIANSGCGLCSAVMVINKLLPKSTFGLEDAINLSYKVKANILAGTQYYIYAPALAKEYGLKYQATKSTKELLNCLRTGGVAVARVAGDREGYVGVFSHGRHYITIVGEEPDGRLAILDPSLKKDKFLIEGRLGKVEIKNDVMVVCDVNVLKEDCLPHDPCYFLFWRG